MSLQSKFSLRGKGWSESSFQPPSSWCLRLRFSTRSPNIADVLRHAASGTAAMSLREKISRSAEALLEIRAQNLPLQFFMSTLNGLGDLVEDEIIPTPIPMKVRFFPAKCHAALSWNVRFADACRNPKL